MANKAAGAEAMQGSGPGFDKGRNSEGGRSFADVLGSSAAGDSSGSVAGNWRSCGIVPNQGPASAPPDAAARHHGRASEAQHASSPASSSANEASQGKARMSESKQKSHGGESSKASAGATSVPKEDGGSTPAIGPLSAAEVEEIAERARTLALSGDAGALSIEAGAEGGTLSKGVGKDQDHHNQGYGSNGAQPPFAPGGVPGNGYGGQGAGMPGGMTPLQLQQMQQMYYAQQQQHMANPGVPGPYAYSQYGYQGEMMSAGDMPPGLLARPLSPPFCRHFSCSLSGQASPRSIDLDSEKNESRPRGGAVEWRKRHPRRCAHGRRHVFGACDWFLNFPSDCTFAAEGMVDDGSGRNGVGMHPNMMHPGMMPPYYGMPMYGGYGAQPGMYGYNKQSQMQMHGPHAQMSPEYYAAAQAEYFAHMNGGRGMGGMGMQWGYGGMGGQFGGGPGGGGRGSKKWGKHREGGNMRGGGSRAHNRHWEGPGGDGDVQSPMAGGGRGKGAGGGNGKGVGNGAGNAGGGVMSGGAAEEDESGQLFSLSLDKIETGTDDRTTLMIRNIPNKYTQRNLLELIDVNHKGTYDFFYLPIDFKNKCNLGYAFINFKQPVHIPGFFKDFANKRWEKFNSEKVCVVSYARIQGQTGLINHFKSSRLMLKHEKYRPLLFNDESGKGEMMQAPIRPAGAVSGPNCAAPRGASGQGGCASGPGAEDGPMGHVGVEEDVEGAGRDAPPAPPAVAAQ